MTPPDPLHSELIRVASTLAARRHVARLVFISDLELPAALVKPAARKKVILVVSSVERRDAIEESGGAVIVLPAYEMARQEKLKLALVAAAARGHLRKDDQVVGLVGRRPKNYPDTLFIARVAEEVAETGTFGEVAHERISPSVFDAIVELALQLGVEGWEGHALGTLFVVGDSARVMESSRQIALNPFQGYSESERNLGDPEVRDALRNFATLDGAFVVREDGVVLAAGRYLQLEPRPDLQIALGLGARHMAAALVTAASDSIAVVVSQSTGKVRVFRRGKVVLELTPSHRRV